MNPTFALPPFGLRWPAWVVAVLCAFSMASVATAQLSEVDLVPGSGDAAVTLDGATGLYWLDLTLTTNVSVPDVLGGSGGWLASGWRYATLSEICTLFATYALAVPTCGGAQSGQAMGNVVGTLQSFVGLTGSDPLSPFSGGLFDDFGDPGRVGVARLLYQEVIDTSSSLVQSSGTIAVAIPNYGNWLVRDDPPPAQVPALTWPLGGLMAVLLTTLATSRARAGRDSKA